MKESYLSEIITHHNEAQDSTRTTVYKAAIAHLMGDALNLQYELTFSDSDEDGQNIAADLAASCLKVLNADILEVADYVEEINKKVEAVKDFLME